MKHSTLALVTALTMPVSVSADVGFDYFFLGYENTRIDGSGGDLSGDSLVIKREFSVFPALAFGAEYANNRFEEDVDQHTAILQGLVYIPDGNFTLVLDAGWLATRIATENLEADEDGPIYSLQGRFSISPKLGLLLGVGRIELDADAPTNVYRADMLMSDGESPVDIVFTYQLSDTPGSSDDVQTYGLGFRCNF